MIEPPSTPSAAVVARDQWWRCLFEASEDAQLVCQTDGAVIEANRRAHQLLGLRGTLALPAFLLNSFLTPGTAAKLAELLARSEGKPETLAAVSVMSHGQLSLVADLLVTPLGEGCALVVIKDASRRWRLESHVQRLISAVNATSDVLYLTDADFKLTFVNAAFQHVTGHTIEEALGMFAESLCAPGDRPKHQACCAAIQRGEDWRGEMLKIRRDDTTYPVEAAVSPIFDKNGLILGCVAFERDISTQKQLQAELEVERDYVHSIIDSVDAAVYSVDHDLNLRYVNRHWRSLPPGHGELVFEQEPQTGGCLLDFVPDPLRREQLRSLLQKVLVSGEAQEFRGTSGAGQEWLVKVTPWMHEGRVLGLNYVVVDQTKFCQLQTQLFQAQKMETIGALAAGVAHDFNNLLLAIRGNVTLLQLDPALEDSVRGRLGQIDHAASRAAEITQQLLSFSRSSEEKEVLLDFNQVVQEATQLARRTLKNRVEIIVDLAASAACVKIDATRANQLLLNLAVNAADAMPNGGSLSIRNDIVPLNVAQAERAKCAPGKLFLRCTVKDTGTGIPPEVLPRIFDPFFTTKAQGKGTGLGLSIVHNVVARAGGILEVESRLGQGTAFLIYLPLVSAEAPRVLEPEEPSLVRGHGRILVVDDMDFILEFTQAFLSAAGYQVLSATCTEEALALLEREEKPPDLILTDYNMPGRSGIDLIREVRSRWPQIKCLLASGYLEEEETRRIEAEVGNGILYKPYNVREATDMVGRVLAGKEPRPHA